MSKKGLIEDGDNVMDLMSKYENGKLNSDEMIQFFQRIINEGLIQYLKGSYREMAKFLIEEGYCIAKK